MRYIFTQKFGKHEKGEVSELTYLRMTDVNLLLHLNIIEEADKAWEPKEGETYWRIDSFGDVVFGQFEKGDNAAWVLGMWPTRKEAESIRDRVREFVKGLKK
jgi:hypothetical protein